MIRLLKAGGMLMINLTAEQQALLPTYWEKWRAIAFSTAPIDPCKARVAVEAGYAAVGREKPLIIFCPSPFAALKHIIHIQVENQFGSYLSELTDLYFDPYFEEMFRVGYLLGGLNLFHERFCMSESIWNEIREQYLLAVKTELAKIQFCQGEFRQLRRRLNKVCYPLNYLGNYISGKMELWVGAVDFSLAVLKVDYDPQKWAAIQSLINECGWIFAFEKIALVCGRPTKISLDSEDRLHAIGEPALVFADGCSMYFYHGTPLPTKYGEVHPQLWSVQGLVNDRLNSTLKDILIENTPPQTINSISNEQIALTPNYLSKWEKVALSTQRINRLEVEKSVKAAYALLGKKAPAVLFCNSPMGILKTVIQYGLSQDSFPELWEELLPPIRGQKHPISARLMEIFSHVKSQLNIELPSLIYSAQRNIINSILARPLSRVIQEQHYKLWNKLSNQIPNEEYQLSYNQEISYHILARNQPPNIISNLDRFDNFSSDSLTEYATYIDYYISELGCICQLEEWEIYKSIAENCWIVIFLNNICIVCDRPLKLSLDSSDRLHAEGEPALQFADGFTFYYNHGVRLPEKYGKLHPQEWRSQWLLEQKNAELRRVLMQGIGYERLCQELQTVEVDSWQEYSLLNISDDVDIEPIQLLTMTCPSTGHLHVLRVPPYLDSAREAIRWINWGTSPEEFAVQT